jgi:hypothetical protein
MNSYCSLRHFYFALDLDVRFDGWKLALIHSMAVRSKEVSKLLDGLLH